MNVFAINVTLPTLDLKTLSAYLNTQPAVRNWLILNETLILVVTTLDLDGLTTLLAGVFNKSYFMIFDARSTNVNGLQTANVWEFINHPSDSGYWESKKN